MSGRLRGKVAIVTGGGSGFGAGIVQRFVAEGARVVVADLSRESGARVAEELGCRFQEANVTSLDSWKAILQATLDSYGQVDIVVNNAGTTYANKPTHTVTPQEFDMVLDVNLRSIYLSTLVLLPYFLDGGRKGVFLNIASTAGIRPRPGLIWYNASKAAVSNATKGMAVEYAPKGIRFNAICPVVAAGTGLTSKFIGKDDTPENMKTFVSTIPIGRSSTPNDVANACVYLGSDEADFITGVNFEVDGGRCV